MSENENKIQKPIATTQEVRADENAVCEACGKFGAYKFGEQFLCVDCYQNSGSCCSQENGCNGE